MLHVSDNATENEFLSLVLSLRACNRDCCAKFVDILGLRTIFPLLMKTPSRKHRRGVSAEEHEEHTVGIVASLLKNCREPHKQRVLAK